MWSVAEPSIIPTGSIVNTLKAYPKKRILFITIRDNTQKTKWCTIGKVNDWIRRYSRHYWIVRGTKGGIHFHLLAGILPDKRVKPQKGIHFHIKSLDHKETLYTDYEELQQSKDKAVYFRNQTFERLTLDIHISKQIHIQQITTMIKHYWRLKTNREQRIIKLTQKEQSIVEVVKYLKKNLLEPRDDDIALYTDYIYKS